MNRVTPRSLITKFLTNELISGSTYIFVGFMISNVLAFLYNLFLARRLSPADYGVYGSLLSIITLLGVPVQSLTPAIVKFSAQYFAKRDLVRASVLFRMMSRFACIVAACVFLAFLVLSYPLSSFLHIDNPMYVVIAGITVALFYLNLVNTAYIQSLLKFRYLAFVTVLSAVIKLIGGALLVLAGARIFGAVGGIGMLALVTYLLNILPVHKALPHTQKKAVSLSHHEIFRYAVPAAVSIFFLTAITSLDVILVKHFFSVHDAGLYAGVSLVGKVIFYFTGAVPVAMFPLIIKQRSLGKKYTHLFFLSLILVIVPSVGITLCYMLFPRLIISLFLGGGRYFAVDKYLGIFGVYLTLFSLVNIFINFFLSINKTRIAFIIIFGVFMQILLISFYHKTLLMVIWASLSVCLVLLLFCIGYYLWQKKSFYIDPPFPPIEPISEI